MPPERTRMEVLWEREVGRLSPKRFANTVMASKEYVQSLNIQKRLRKHRGCVNTISFNADGRLLLSGSDDRNLVLWDWQEAAPAVSFHTGHSSNVYHALFMPVSGDRSIVSCAADGEVIHSLIQEGGRVITDKLVQLEYPVHRLAVEPASPHTFYCCCQDSSVWLFDLRGANAMELFKCRAAEDCAPGNIELNAIALDPNKPCCIAVAGADQYVRIYDSRKIFVDGSSSSSRPTEHFCPPHMLGREEITGLAYSQTSELLASYSGEDIYLFSREHGFHFNNVDVNKLFPPQDDSDPFVSFLDKLPIPKSFTGHENEETMKGVNFLGPNCDFVTSGSDCGSIFIWRKKDAELIRAVRGDKRIVNCVEQHPCGTVLASSGIDKDIKIWEPGEGENLSITQAHEDDDEDIWISSDYDSDSFIINDGFGFWMHVDPIRLYENGDHESEEDEDTSSEDDDGDNSAQEDDDGDNIAEEEDFDGGNSAGDEGDD